MAQVPAHTHTFEIPTATETETEAGTRDDVVVTPASLSPVAGGKQPLDAGLTSISGLATASDTMLYITAADAYATTALTPFARSILDDADAATVRTTLALGTAATTDASAYATATQGTKADSAVQPADLSAVATSGDYDDLGNLPTLGTAAAQDTTAFAPAAQAVPIGGGAGQVLAKASGTDNDVEWTNAGTGDVVGPSSATDGHVVLFDGTTGNAVKDGGATGTTGLAVLGAEDGADFDAAIPTGSKVKARLTETFLSDYLGAADPLTAALADADRIVITEAYPVPADITIGAGKTLDFRGGSFDIASGATVAFNNQANIVAGRELIFSGSGTVSNLRVALPEWWGAVQSVSVSSRSALDKALTALRNNGILWLDQGFYAMEGTTPLDCSNGQIIVGEGDPATTIRILTAATNFSKWTATTGGGVRNLRISNNSATPTSGYTFDFQDNDASKGSIERVTIERCWNFCRLKGTNAETFNAFSMRGFRAFDVHNEGIRLDGAENIWLSEGIVDGIGSGSASMFIWQNKVQALLAERIIFSNCNRNGLEVSNSGSSISRGADARWNKVVSCVFDDCRTGADLNYLSGTDFIDCWFNSNGRTPSRSQGYGLQLRLVSGLNFDNCQFCNNGEHGIRYENGSRFVFFDHCRIAGNNVNDTSAWGAWIQGGASDWCFSFCTFGNDIFGWTAGAQVGPVLVNSGGSDRYQAVFNRFVGMSNNAVYDNGSGSNKDVTTGNLAVAT